MAKFKRRYRFDKRAGCLVEETPEGDKAVCESLQQDTATVRRSMKRRSAKVFGRAKWPITPESAAIDPEDIPKVMELAKRRGVPTEYDRIGRPIITGPDHYRKYCRAFDYYQRNSYDSPKNR